MGFQQQQQQQSNNSSNETAKRRMDMVQGHLMLNDNPYEHTRREFFAKQDQSLAVATHGNNPSSCSSNNNAAASITHRRYAAAEADEDGLVTRLIQKSDYYKGFLDILSQLTVVGTVTAEQFAKRIDEMEASNGTYFIVVIEDTKNSKIVATAALIVEKKFVHDCGAVGHIEDVVVNSSYRGKNLGKRVIEELKKIGKEQGCYKIILDCAAKNVAFYEKCGFVKKELQMRYDVK